MGNNLNRQSPEEVRNFLITLENFSQEGECLDSNKLFTTVKLSADNTNYLLSKVHIKTRDVSRYKQVFDTYKKRIQNKIVTHVLYSELLESGNIVLIIRQFIDKTLRKKLRTPPFYNDIEKTWITYQCLRAVSQLHSINICHGDLKSENFLVTSWNWVFLSDIAFYKPSFVVEGDLTTYKLFFGTGERPACYLAPEKFSVKERTDEISKEMDIFSLACVIAEIWLDGQYLFTLPDLLTYKKTGKLTRLYDIKNEKIREMVLSMLAQRPEERKSIFYYIHFFESEIMTKELLMIYEVVEKITLGFSYGSAFQRISFIKESIKNIEKTEDLLILAHCITANIKNVQTAEEMIFSLRLIIKISACLTDQCKLHKILPYFLSIVQNKAEKARVKVECIFSVIRLLKDIKIQNARDSHLFTEYIWNTLSLLINDESEYVRSAFARSLPVITEIGYNFIKYLDESLEKPGNLAQELEKFTDRIIKVFKQLMVSKPECQIHTDLLSNFAEICAFLDRRSVLNNIIPIILSWLNKGDWYRSLILSQIPKLLTYMNTSEFIDQIFTCIEDGLSNHNEVVVYKTLKILEIGKEFDKNVLLKIAKNSLHPNQWIRNLALSIFSELIKRVDSITNFSVIREVLVQYINLPEYSIAVVDQEILLNFYDSYKRKDMLNPGSDRKLKSLLDISKVKDQKIPLTPILSKEDYAIFEHPIDTQSHKKPRISIGKLSFRDSLKLSGKLITCFNEHTSSVSNLHIHLNTLLSSSENSVKTWQLSQLNAFRPLKSQESSKFSSTINTLGSCGDNVFLSTDSEILFFPRLDLQRPVKIFTEKVIKTLSLSENTISAISKTEILKIFDTRSLAEIQSYHFPFYGPLSNICQSPNANILCLSTYTGSIILYDIRFPSVSSVLFHSSGLPIFSIQSYDSKSLLVASEDISLLNIYTNNVNVVLSSSNDSPRIPAFCDTLEKDWLIKSCFNISSRVQKVFESTGIVRKVLSPGKPFVLSGGNDCLVKLWNIDKPSESRPLGVDKDSFDIQVSEMNYGDVKIIQQRFANTKFQDGPFVTHSLKRAAFQETPAHRQKDHMDTVLDMVLENGSGYLVTGSRDGSIKVWV